MNPKIKDKIKKIKAIGLECIKDHVSSMHRIIPIISGTRFAIPRINNELTKSFIKLILK